MRHVLLTEQPSGPFLLAKPRELETQLRLAGVGAAVDKALVRRIRQQAKRPAVLMT